jgi:hypothetical protein
VKIKTLYETFTPEKLETIYRTLAASPQPGGIGAT